jgi:hypothetical protein
MSAIISLGQLEQDLRTKRALGEIARAYSHRARREDCLGFLIGRDAILADWTNQPPSYVTILHETSDMVVYKVAIDDRTWIGHRWVHWEDGRIVSETLIENQGLLCTAPPIHAPLGELRAGRGQFDAGDQAILPKGFCAAAVGLVTVLHQAWNGRALNLYDAYWLTSLLKLLPDATFYFERAQAQADHISLLWRVLGHHKSGQRVRLIGSSVMAWDGLEIQSDQTCLDFAALDAQLVREIVTYA